MFFVIRNCALEALNDVKKWLTNGGMIAVSRSLLQTLGLFEIIKQLRTNRYTMLPTRPENEETGFLISPQKTAFV